uniref:Uncharacterized protein n=1 Tax=Odontella aurita TaxID=265563 RepID=A0A7S4NH60_9STRA|mmetsp:Transcript_7020/g.21009  ORF Transcript_7020/g.21009 Transcript_7020/m.21009 type:complete len:157 (+) Transcript_7020:453-923(+)
MFHSLPTGSLVPQDPRTVRLLEETSAGIVGWADARVLGEESKQKDDEASFPDSDTKEKFQAGAGDDSGTTEIASVKEPVPRSDEEESRQLRIAMLESIGVRPGCDAEDSCRQEADSSCKEDESASLCYYSSDDNSADDDSSSKEREEARMLHRCRS